VGARVVAAAGGKEREREAGAVVTLCGGGGEREAREREAREREARERASTRSGRGGVACTAGAFSFSLPAGATKRKSRGLKDPSVFSRVRKTPEHLRCTSSYDMPAQAVEEEAEDWSSSHNTHDPLAGCDVEAALSLAFESCTPPSVLVLAWANQQCD